MNGFCFAKNLVGVSNEESLIEVSNANPVNWIAGHIVISRNNLFKEVGLKEFIDESMDNIYQRGSKLSNKEIVKDITEIKNLFDQSQKIIMDELSGLEDPKKLEQFAFFAFHESYHIGQIGIVRKLIGKEGAIK
jgi:hypothetical protein